MAAPIRRREWPVLRGPEEAAFQHDRHEQLAVAVLVEQHGDLVAVVPLHRALAPALAHDACAHGEWDLSGPASVCPRSLSRVTRSPADSSASWAPCALACVAA